MNRRKSLGAIEADHKHLGPRGSKGSQEN